jgi:hypothetical protein
MLGELYYKNKFLDVSECQLLIDHFGENEKEATRGPVGYPPNATIDFQRRIDKILTIDASNEKLKPIIDKVVEISKIVNDDVFLFDIDWNHYKNPKNKSIFISQYDGVDKGHWAKHQCVNWISNHMQNKLCATLVLSDTKDYEGGDILLSFATAKEQPTPTEFRTKGILYIYPAFRFTQVCPVLSGCKYHLDFRFSGPYWR